MLLQERGELFLDLEQQLFLAEILVAVALLLEGVGRREGPEAAEATRITEDQAAAMPPAVEFALT